MSDTGAGVPVPLVVLTDLWPRRARCSNYLEDEDRPCTGVLSFGPGDLQAACESCGAWCGFLVADYLSGR